MENSPLFAISGRLKVTQQLPRFDLINSMFEALRLRQSCVDGIKIRFNKGRHVVAAENNLDVA